MTTVATRGFTVIELMLFLAITGAIFAALMIGVNNNIIQQQYKGSVQEYGYLLQNQYSEVANTRNGRDVNLQCKLDAAGDVAVSSPTGGGDLPGAPSVIPACVVLGRAIEVGPGGASVHVYPVVGLEPASGSSLSDLDALIAYKPNITDQFETISTDLNYGTSLKLPGGNVSEASFLILRSPSSGLIRVFASSNPLSVTSTNPLKADIISMITLDNATMSVKNCVDGQRGLLPRQSVMIDPKVAGADGVVINENDPECRS